MKTIDMLRQSSVTETIERIAREYRLRLVMLYGSVARGTETAMSDVDIGVLGKRPLSYEDEAMIGEQLAHASGLPRIEVKSLHRVSPLFLSEVMNGAVLYADTSARAQELALYAWKLATEQKPLRDARYAQTRERILSYA